MRLRLICVDDGFDGGEVQFFSFGWSGYARAQFLPWFSHSLAKCGNARAPLLPQSLKIRRYGLLSGGKRKDSNIIHHSSYSSYQVQSVLSALHTSSSCSLENTSSSCITRTKKRCSINKNKRPARPHTSIHSQQLAETTRNKSKKGGKSKIKSDKIK